MSASQTFSNRPAFFFFFCSNQRVNCPANDLLPPQPLCHHPFFTFWYVDAFGRQPSSLPPSTATQKWNPFRLWGNSQHPVLPCILFWDISPSHVFLLSISITKHLSGVRCSSSSYLFCGPVVALSPRWSPSNGLFSPIFLFLVKLLVFFFQLFSYSLFFLLLPTEQWLSYLLRIFSYHCPLFIIFSDTIPSLYLFNTP